MNYKLLSFLIICLTVGLIASCGGSSNPLVGEAKSNVQSGNNEAALASAEQSIQQYPGDPLGYYYKGVALGQKAQNLDDPFQANEFYVQSDNAFNTATSVADTIENVPEEIEFIGSVRNGFWQAEHNLGVQYATDDSLMATVESPLDRSVAHLKNATTIQPDSVLSFEVLAQVNNMREDYGAAAEAQAKVLEMTENPDAQAYLLLSQFYRLNDQPQDAAEVLAEAREMYPENVQITEALADTYSQIGEAGKAIDIVEALVEQDPSNPQYRLSYGTRLYQAALELQSTYDENFDELYNLRQQLQNAQGQKASNLESQIEELRQENEELRSEIEDLTSRAISELNTTLESNPNEAVAYNTLGIIYQNRAAVIFDERNMTSSNEEAARLDQEAKTQLEKAMQNYEKAAEIEPENQSYWRSLFQVYTALGMDEKAAEAEAKAGMQ